MNNTDLTRIDEVSRYYESASTIDTLGFFLFWINALLSVGLLYSSKLDPYISKDLLQVAFIVLVVIYFIIFQFNKFYLIPKAERIRRKQMLSDAFGSPLIHERTSLYYNNQYTPSIKRLAANTMENALFSKEVTSRMLFSKRITIVLYIAIWVFAFALRGNDLNTLIWITQLVFSGEIIVQWLNLETLHVRFERIYEKLHSHFLHGIGGNSQKAIATILDTFVAYEAAKSSAGYLLSIQIFNELNPKLTQKWKQIRSELNMDT